MSLAVIILPTNKTKSTVTDHVRKIGQGEKGLTLEVIVTDANSNGYDLTDKNINFSENKVGGKIVSDGAVEHFERLDDKAGRFRYKLADAVYAASGSAWFDISSKDGSVIDTTKSFDIDVIEDATIHVNNDNYVSTLTALETHYKAVIQRAEDDNVALLAKFNQQFKDAVDSGNRNIQQVIDSANKLIADWSAELSNEQQALIDLQNDWKRQTEQINADYQAQKTTIQSDAQETIAKIDTDKQAAIAKANTDFQNKLDSIQTDYNSWKQTTLADFQKQLDKLEKELSDDEDAQAELQKAIDKANEAILQIKGVDFTQFAHLSDLENYYDKITVDKKLATAGKLKQISVNGGPAVSPDDNGVANITVSDPDLSKLETKDDAKKAHELINEELAKRPQSVNGITGDNNGDITLPMPDISGIKNDISNVQADLKNVQGQITSNAQSSMKSWNGTLAQYQALSSYDPMTMYFIISDYEVVVK